MQVGNSQRLTLSYSSARSFFFIIFLYSLFTTELFMNYAAARVLCITLALLLLTCAPSGQRSGVPEAIDYAAIQEKAAHFAWETGTAGGELVRPSFSGPRSFNPITSTDLDTREITGLMYEGLVRINPITLTPEPGLAQSWTVSPDGLVWDFSLRPGLVWSDVAPLTAQDVEFTFDSLVFNDSINPNSARDLFTIDGKRPTVSVVDSETVRFTLPAPSAPFLRAMAQEILPRHKFRSFTKWNSFSGVLSVTTPPDSMPGTGPFVLESFIAGRTTTLKRNPLYWQKDSAGKSLPYLSRVVFSVVADQNEELARIKRGQIDYMKAKGEDYPSLVKGESRGNYTVYRLGPASGSYFVLFNQNGGRDSATGRPFVDPAKHRWFSSRSFRQAVALSIDRQAMIRNVMNGLGYPQRGPMSPSEGYFYNPDVSDYPFDTAAARDLLAKEGLTDRNHDGVLEDAAGHPLEFTLYTNSGNIVRTKLAEAICKNLGAVGMKVHLMHQDFGGLTERIDKPPYAWEAVLLGLSGNVDPHFGSNVWRSSGYLHMWNPGQKVPATPWEARIDTIFDRAGRELDNGKRKELYDEWQRIVATELPLVYTVLPEQIFCLSNKFRNVNPSVTGGLLHSIERLYVTTPQPPAGK
jgi:peptide/nickel transport system substrate-binding protein